MTRMLTFCAVVLCLASATGCTDLKPLQAQVDELTQRVARLSSDQVSLKASVGNAASIAHSTVEQAQNRADAAASAAQAAQQSCDEINEKIDRMFKRSPQK
jgi:outer membrane murein-binding lipoprotein Lpp